MTSVFSAEGKNVPCTVIEAGPCVVTQVKTVEKDGYEAVQLGFQDKKEKHTTKPLMGHFKKAGVTPKKHLAEFKEFETELNLGDTVTVELFNDATFVDVVGTSKGKGFQGVVKRHGFGGVGQTTHGQHNRARKPVLSVLVLTCKSIQRNAHGRTAWWRQSNCSKPAGIKGNRGAQSSFD